MWYFFLKLSFCWGLFALFYAFFLRKQTFYHANRLYLLSTLCGSVFLALWESTAGKYMPAWEMPVLLSVAQTYASQEVQELNYGWGSFFSALYVSGVALTSLRLCLGLGQLSSLVRQSSAIRYGRGVYLVESEAVHTPFSFYNRIFIPKDLDSAQCKAVLEHELAHLENLHGLDLIVLELFGVLFWFHPLVYWYKNTLRCVHEYQADARAVATTTRRQYARLLMHQSGQVPQPIFTHLFYQSPLKQRIIMLGKKPSAAMQQLRYFAVLPLIMAYLTLFNVNNAQAQTVDKGALDVQPQFPGGQAALFQFLGSRIQYPTAVKRQGIQGLIYAKLIVERDGKISDISFERPRIEQSGAGKTPKDGATSASLEQAADLMQQEVSRVVRMMPHWNPGQKAGKTVRSQVVLPVKFALE